MSKNYYFIDKERLRIKSKSLTAKIERMYETYGDFIDLLEALRKEPYIDFTNLEMRAGLDEKLLKKLTNAIEEYRRIYFDKITDIFQTSIEDFTKTFGGV